MNEIKQFYIMCGIPGSGKSTFAKKITEIYEKHNISIETVSRDEIRFSLIKPGEDYFSKEKEVFSIYIENLKKSLNNNNNYRRCYAFEFCIKKKIINPFSKRFKKCRYFLSKNGNLFRNSLRKK